MQEIIVFVIPTIIGLLIIYRWTVRLKKFQIEMATAATIILYRLIAFWSIIGFEKSQWWQMIDNDGWNHYQLGLVILLFGYVFRNYLKNNNRKALTGIGSGMIIDEITDVLKLLTVPMPLRFRDSWGDTMLIIITFTVFVLAKKYWTIKVNKA